MKTRHYLLLLTAVSVQLLASFANADSRRPDEARRVAVSYADLDLSKPAGADALYKRIRLASERVCRVYESRDLPLIATSRGCYRSTVNAAVAQVNHPRLTALHDRKVGKEATVLSARR